MTPKKAMEMIGNRFEQNTINVGDRVKSFDFEGNRDCYVIGRVESIGRFQEFFNDCKRYKIKVESATFEGETKQAKTVRYVYPPVNGTLSWTGRAMNGVEKV
jgi:hypothetical protein